MNPLQGSGVSERSRCGAVPILAVAEEPSTGIGRVGALSLWCRAHPCRGRGTLYRDRACRSALAVVPCPSLPWPMNPLQGSGVSERSRCGAVRILAARRWTLYRDRACRSALAVVPRPSCRGPMNPLQESGVSERSRCGAVRILELADEASTGIGRVGALSLWCRAHPCRGRWTLYRDRACRSALAVVPCASLSSPMNPLQGSGVSERSRCGAVRILELADEPSTGIGRVAALSLWCRAHPWAVRILELAALAVVSGVSRILELADEPSTGIGRVGALALRRGAVRILELADEPSTGIGRVGSLAGEPSAGIGVVPCESLSSPMNPLQGSGVSHRSPANPLRGSVWCRANPWARRWTLYRDRACRIARRRTLCGDRCGAVRILELADEPSTGIGRVGSLAGEPSAGIGVVPCESLSSPMNPLQGSGASDRSPANPLRGSVWCRANPWARRWTLYRDRARRIARRRTLCGDRCGAVRILELADEPSTGIGRVGSLAGEPSAGIGVVPCESLSSPMNPLQGSGVSDRSPANPLRGSVWCRANPWARRWTLHRDRACRSALAVVPCESLSSPANPLRGSGVSDRSPANPLRGSVWCRANPGARRWTLCGDRACRSALAVVPCESLSSPANPLRGSGVSDRSPANPLRGSVWCRANPWARRYVHGRSPQASLMQRIASALARMVCHKINWCPGSEQCSCCRHLVEACCNAQHPRSLLDVQCHQIRHMCLGQVLVSCPRIPVAHHFGTSRERGSWTGRRWKWPPWGMRWDCIASWSIAKTTFETPYKVGETVGLGNLASCSVVSLVLNLDVHISSMSQQQLHHVHGRSPQASLMQRIASALARMVCHKINWCPGSEQCSCCRHLVEACCNAQHPRSLLDVQCHQIRHMCLGQVLVSCPRIPVAHHFGTSRERGRWTGRRWKWPPWGMRWDCIASWSIAKTTFETPYKVGETLGLGNLASCSVVSLVLNLDVHISSMSQQQLHHVHGRSPQASLMQRIASALARMVCHKINWCPGSEQCSCCRGGLRREGGNRGGGGRPGGREEGGEVLEEEEGDFGRERGG